MRTDLCAGIGRSWRRPAQRRPRQRQGSRAGRAAAPSGCRCTCRCGTSPVARTGASPVDVTPVLLAHPNRDLRSRLEATVRYEDRAIAVAQPGTVDLRLEGRHRRGGTQWHREFHPDVGPAVNGGGAAGRGDRHHMLGSFRHRAMRLGQVLARGPGGTWLLHVEIDAVPALTDQQRPPLRCR
jgi:hypothetical protein